MSNRPIQRLQQIKSFVVTIVLILEIAVECDAQTHETTLGVVHAIATPGSFSNLRQFPDHNNALDSFVLWNGRSRDLAFAGVDSTLTHVLWERHSVRIPFDDVLIADLNHDSKPDLVFLSIPEKTITVVVNLVPDTLDAITTIQLPFAPTGWRLGDINNDGNMDIVVFDRNNPGIVPLIGNGKGRFVIRKTIAPELPVGSLTLTHLNNDNLIDIVSYDWVKSELHLLYGIGRGRFLDQSTFLVRGEVSDIIATRVDPGSILDLVLVTKHPAEVQEWKGNGIGDFRLTKLGRLDDDPVASTLGDMNNDQWMDFGYVDKSASLQIVMNSGDEWSSDRIQFAAGKDPTSVLFKDFNRDGRTDALVLDRAGKSLLFFFNGEQDNTLRDSLEFATAPEPAGIVIHPAGFGSGNDLAVVNTKGRSLSLFTGRTQGGLLGQTSYSLSLEPQMLSFHSMTDSTARFVVTSGAGDSLLMLSLNYKDSSSSYAVIPSEGTVEVVYTGIDAHGQADFLTFNSHEGDENPAIHYYERLNPGTFIEQSFRLNKPDELLGATANFINQDRYPDLVYVYRNADSGNVDLVVSYGDSLMTYGQRHSTLELPPTKTKRSYLWTFQSDGGRATDLMIYFGAPSKTLQWARGKDNGQFDQPIILLQNVRLANRSMVQIVDADNDGFPDLVVNNAGENALGWFHGKSDGTFEPWRRLIDTSGNEFFAVGDVNGDGIADIALCRKSQGTITVYDGARLFGKESRAEN